VAKNPGRQAPYIPQRGDIVWIDFDPSQGSEIQKTRPALVVSPLNYNEKVGLALLCPITSHTKGYPFEVDLCFQKNLKGVVLADQVKSLDWEARNAKFIMKAPVTVINEVIQKLSVLIAIT
jgi:mRNA interferase MazF